MTTANRSNGQRPKEYNYGALFGMIVCLGFAITGFVAFLHEVSKAHDASKVGLIIPLQWVLNGPLWLSLSAGFVLTYGFLLFARVVIENRSPNLHKNYKGVWPGDAFLATCLLFLNLGVKEYIRPSVHGWWQQLWAQAIFVLLSVLFAGVFAYGEISNTYKHRQNPLPSTYITYQLRTPTSLIHRLITLIMPYLLLAIGSAVMCTATVPLWLKVAVATSLGGWLYCI